MEHVRNKTKIERELIINLKWDKLRSGLAQSIYIDTNTKLPHLPDGRTKWLREFLAKLDGSLICEEVTVPPSNCANEHAIMDLVLKLNLREKEIVAINDVREHLKVYWASDVIDIHKRTLLPFYTFKTTTEESQTKYKLPEAPAPTIEQRKIWVKALEWIKTKLCTTTDGKPFRLLVPTRRGREWKYEAAPSNNPQIWALTQHGTPISSLQQKGRHLIATNGSIPTIHRLYSILLMSRNNDKWTFRSYDVEGVEVKEEPISKHFVIAVSDGYVRYGKGASAAVIAENLVEREFLIHQTLRSRVHGNPVTLNSFRAEA